MARAIHLWMFIALSLFLGACSKSAPDIEATTKEGRTVVLKGDGTWAFVGEMTDSPLASDEPAVASGVMREIAGKSGYYAIRFDPEIWELTSIPAGNPAELYLQHLDGDVYVMVYSERLSVSVESMRNAGVENAKAASEDFKDLAYGDVTVDSQRFLSAQFSCMVRGLPVRYYAYYWSGGGRGLQIVTYTSQDLFSKYESAMHRLLGDVRILQASAVGAGEAE